MNSNFAIQPELHSSNSLEWMQEHLHFSILLEFKGVKLETPYIKGGQKCSDFGGTFLQCASKTLTPPRPSPECTPFSAKRSLKVNTAQNVDHIFLKVFDNLGMDRAGHIMPASLSLRV